MGHDFGNGADGVREIFFGGENGNERAFGEVAVADFAATGGTHAVTFADSVAWGVIMVHIAAFAVGNFHSVDELGEGERGESNDVKGLCDATSEDGRTVGAR